MQAGEVELISRTADLIVKFGFLGVGLVLVFLVAPFVLKVWKSKALTLGVACFGIAFIAVFGILDIAQRYFPDLISSKRMLLNGVVTDVPNGFQVEVSSDSRTAGAAYLKREYHPKNAETFNHYFVLLASQPPRCLWVGINNNNPASETGVSGFRIAPISADDLRARSDLVAAVARLTDGNFQIRYWREENGRMIGKPVLLQRLAAGDPDCSSGEIADAGPGSFTLAQASSARDVQIRLQSDDLVTRRNARIDLSRQGPQAIGMIRDFLNSGNYRLQIGAVVALSLMNEPQRRQLPPDIVAKVRELSGSSDAAMREAAQAVLR